MSTPARKWFIETALAYLGTPYVWGGDDPSGFDCSGFVIECLKSAGLLHESDDYTANGLWLKFDDYAIDKPRRGALMLLFDENERAQHISICLDEHFQIGASGGGRGTVDTNAAWEQNAYVRIRPIRFDSRKMKVVDPIGTAS